MTISAHFMKVYRTFIERDAYSYPLYPRDWEYIHNHLMLNYDYLNFITLTGSDNYDVSKTNKDAKNSVEISKELYNLWRLSIEKSKNSIIDMEAFDNMTEFGTQINFTDFDNKDKMVPIPIFQPLYWFLYVYNYVYKINKSLVHNSLSEYHHAMTYMLPIFYKENSQFDYEMNIKSAQAHIIRGTLDICRSMIEYKKDLILSDEKLLGLFYRLQALTLKNIGIANNTNPKNKSDIAIQYIKYIKRITNPKYSHKI